jgi:hypothetical protein
VRRDYKLTLNQLRQGSGNIYKARAIAGRERKVFGGTTIIHVFTIIFFSFLAKGTKKGTSNVINPERENNQPVSLS